MDDPWGIKLVEGADPSGLDEAPAPERLPAPRPEAERELKLPVPLPGHLLLTARQYLIARGTRVEHYDGFLVDAKAHGWTKFTRPQWEVLYQRHLARPV